MTLSFEVGDRFIAAADEWADARMVDREEALSTKAEQALLEVENLVSGAHEVEFEVDGRTVRHEPSEDLRALLDEQAASTGLDPATLLKLHVDVYANAFLDSDEERPPNAPPTDG